MIRFLVWEVIPEPWFSHRNTSMTRDPAKYMMLADCLSINGDMRKFKLLLVPRGFVIGPPNSGGGNPCVQRGVLCSATRRNVSLVRLNSSRTCEIRPFGRRGGCFVFDVRCRIHVCNIAVFVYCTWYHIYLVIFSYFAGCIYMFFSWGSLARHDFFYLWTPPHVFNLPGIDKQCSVCGQLGMFIIPA